MARRLIPFVSFALVAACGADTSESAAPRVDFARTPPGPRAARDVPQLVAVTFDDNFGLANERASGGVAAIVDYYRGKANPAGAGQREDFDGAPLRTTFFHTSVYALDEGEQAFDGAPGEDQGGRNLKAWRAARDAGHEVAVHTVHHFNGGIVPLDPDDCCRARDFDAASWEQEIDGCRDLLTSARGLGASPADVVGFRAPFLGFNDALFDALSARGFLYDTSIPSCYAENEDGTNCAWPYTLHAGSPDAEALAARSGVPDAPFSYPIPRLGEHAGLWELSPTTLIVPPDDQAERYGFAKGLRARIAARPQPLPYPSLYDAPHAKIAGLDYSLLIDAGLSGAEMAAVLSYNLDLHLAGNRAPLVFVAHAHLYAYTEGDAEAPEDDKDNPDTPSAAVRDERFAGLTRFLEYAREHDEVRIVAARDVIDWVAREAERAAQ